MHDALLETVRKAFTDTSPDAKGAALDALRALLDALASPASSSNSSSSPPISSASVAASAFAPSPSPSKSDQVSIALDALIAKFRSMLPPGVEAPHVEPALSIPFVPVPTWGHG